MKQVYALRLGITLALIWLAILASACATQPAAPTATPTVAPASAGGAATLQPEPGTTVEPDATGALAEVADSSKVGDIGTAVADRTPVPTPTPGFIAEQVDDLAQATGLAGKSFLGLAVEDWINLVVSALIVIVGYFVGIRLLRGLLRRVVRRTETTFDDAFLDTIGDELKWLVMVLVLRLAILRLPFLGDWLRTVLDDVFLVLGLSIVTIIAFKLINFGAQWYKDNWEHQEDRDRLDPILTILQRLGYVLLIIVVVSIGLSHFGIDVTVLSVTLIFVALIISLGARDIVSDLINGFLILLDQPFRVGDTIQIEELDKRGTVTDIGNRNTSIRTGDNRSVIIPNSKIGTSQVINDTYPDPTYRVQTDIGVAYGSDYHQVRRVITDAVRGVEGVLPDQPVDVFFLEFGDSDRTMRVRWWIDTIDDEYPMLDRVNAALESALDEAGIDMPLHTYALNVRMEGEKASTE